MELIIDNYDSFLPQSVINTWALEPGHPGDPETMPLRWRGSGSSTRPSGTCLRGLDGPCDAGVCRTGLREPKGEFPSGVCSISPAYQSAWRYRHLRLQLMAGGNSLRHPESTSLFMGLPEHILVGGTILRPSTGDLLPEVLENRNSHYGRREMSRNTGSISSMGSVPSESILTRKV